MLRGKQDYRDVCERASFWPSAICSGVIVLSNPFTRPFASA
jgi:hypothetical protein